MSATVTVTAEQVKELRERTGAGMMECKKALVEAHGDIEKAIDDMRKASHVKADKKAGRIAAKGVVAVKCSADGKEAAIVEVNSETDFVALGDDFKGFADGVAATALATRTDSVDALQDATLVGGETTINAARQALIAKIGENIQVRRFVVMIAQGMVGSYVHGGRIGVLVDVVGGTPELHKDIAMHIAASNPRVVEPADVSEEVVAKEREICFAQVLETKKPKEIIEKIVDGRMKKFFDEVCLVGQPFVKDPDQSVGAVLQKAQAKVISFVRFEVGEGIEVQTMDFAAEVMAQIGAH